MSEGMFSYIAPPSLRIIRHNYAIACILRPKVISFALKMISCSLKILSSVL